MIMYYLLFYENFVKRKIVKCYNFVIFDEMPLEFPKTPWYLIAKSYQTKDKLRILF